MKKTELPDGVLIEFGNMVNRRKRLSMMLVSIAYFAFAIAAVYQLYDYILHRVINGENNPFGEKDSIGVSIMLTTVMTAALIFVSLAFWRFLKRSSDKESLLITQAGLTLTTTKLGKTKSRLFDIDGIMMVSFADKSGHGPELTGYAKSLGQGLVFAVNAEGNLVIVYDGEIIKFGKDLYSWHAEELSEMMQTVTGGKLSIQNIPGKLNEFE